MSLPIEGYCKMKSSFFFMFFKVFLLLLNDLKLQSRDEMFNFKTFRIG